MAPRVWTGIAAPVAVVSVLLLVIAVGSAWYLRYMQESVANILADNVESMRAAQELELSVRDLRLQGIKYLATKDPDDRQKILKQIPGMRDRVMTALTHAESLAHTPAEQTLMRRTRDGLQKFFAQYEQMTAGDTVKVDLMTRLGLIDPVLAQEVIEPTRDYLKLNEGALAQANEENRRVTSQLTTGLVVLGLCGAFGGLLGGWVIASALRRAMLRTEERLRDTARQLDDAARTTEDSANRAGRSVDALDDVAKSASAVLDRLKQTERDALRAEQLAWAGQMAAGIAHEVRNPLMAIKLLIQALADGRTGDRLRPRDMQVLEEEIVRLEQIVGSFLDFARPPRPDKKPVAVGPLVEQVADRIRGRADLQGVKIEVAVPRRPIVAEIDPGQFQQVLYNLLFNAIEAQPGGGRVRLSISAESGMRNAELTTEPERSGSVAHPPFRSPHVAFLMVVVEDDGPGLPAQVRDRVFEPFVSTKEAGLGLGLSICRRIVEGHGGEIRTADRDEGGAAFVVRLPLTRPHLPDSTEPERSLPPPSREARDVETSAGR